jgi:predicted glycoside hydrolase/deacetylase ChbG (UPF0249 family)
MTAENALIVCADDFGLSEAVSETILTLLRSGGVDATSCLVANDAWPSWARELRALAERRPDVQIGLHLQTRSFGVSAFEALVSFEEQWSRFEAAIGRAPDFIDGHRHTHLFPGPKRALFRLLETKPARPWLRQCRTSSARLIEKRLVLDPLSLAFAREAKARGYRVNAGFGGLRRFWLSEDLDEIWRADIAAMPSGGVLMTHPGAPDANDSLSGCRAQEAALLARRACAAVATDQAPRSAPWIQ